MSTLQIVASGGALATVNMAAVQFGAPPWIVVGILSGIATVAAVVALREHEAANKARIRLIAKTYKAELMRSRWLKARDGKAP